jgi:hypothetical protein
MLGKLYPLGYTAQDAGKRFVNLMEDERTVLVDIRFNPVSRHYPPWGGKALKEIWSGRYYPLSCLGNENYKGGPIKIADPDLGIPVLMRGLQQGYNLILLCACKSYDTCHRKVVCEMVKAVLPNVEIVL